MAPPMYNYPYQSQVQQPPQFVQPMQTMYTSHAAAQAQAAQAQAQAQAQARAHAHAQAQRQMMQAAYASAQPTYEGIGQYAQAYGHSS